MPEITIRLQNYIGESQFNWDTFEFEYATNADDVRMAVEWAQYDGVTVDGICLEIGTCFGGSTIAGTEIYNYLQGLGLPIRTRILSLAASMATLLMLVGDTVEIDHTAQILVHGPSGGGRGTVTQLASTLKDLSDTHALLHDIYVARTGQSSAVVQEWMSKDTFFTAEEALAVGLVTKVIPIAPKSVPVLTDAQASARRAKYAGITARADKRALAARQVPTPNAKNAALPAAQFPRPMAQTKRPITAAAKKVAGKPATAPTEQAAKIAAVQAFAKQMGVKIKAEGEETTAAVEATVLADDAGTVYTDGPLAQGSAVFNDEALTVATADAEYETEDGRVFVVAAGVVESVTEATDDAAAGDDAAPAASTEALTAAVTAALAPLTQRLDGLEAKFNKAVPPTPRALAKSGQMADGKTPRPKAAHHAGL